MRSVSIPISTHCCNTIIKCILLVFLATSASAQDTTKTKIDLASAQASLSAVNEQLSDLFEEKDKLESLVSTLQSELLKARISSGDHTIKGLSVRTLAAASLYPSPSASTGAISFGDQDAMLVEFSGAKARLMGPNGENGWLMVSMFDFKEDPEAFIDESILAGQLSSVGQTILKSRVSVYKMRTAELQRQGLSPEEATARENQSILERATQARALDKLRAQGIPIIIERFRHPVNSAGGVEPVITLSNISDKEIKYIHVSGKVFNPVGDPARNEHGDRTNELKIRLVGPVPPRKPNVTYSYEDDPPFYNGISSCIELRRVVVEYMDGTSFIMMNDLKEARRSESDYKIQNEC